MYQTIRAVLLTLGLVLLCACGGGATTYSAAPGGSSTGSTVDVEGLWTGSFTVTGSSSSSVIYAAIAENGYAFFYDQNGVIYVLPSLSGSTTLSGTLTAFAPSGFTFGSSGLTQETFALTATVASNSITGSFTGNGETGNFTLTPYAPLSANNPALIAGNWQGFYVGSGSSAALALVVQSGGVFVGTDSNGCALTGSIAQLQSSSTQTPENLFTVTVDSVGSHCLGNLSGLAFESKTDASGLFGNTAGTYYYVGVSSATGAFVAELKVQ